MLSLLHAAIMFPLTNAYDTPREHTLGFTVEHHGCFRRPSPRLGGPLGIVSPALGVPNARNPDGPKHITIFALLRLTTKGAIAATVLRISGSILDDIIGFSIDSLLDRARVTDESEATCIANGLPIGISGRFGDVQNVSKPDESCFRFVLMTTIEEKMTIDKKTGLFTYIPWYNENSNPLNEYPTGHPFWRYLRGIFGA